MPPHRVVALAHEGIAPFELGVVAEVFALPRPELDVPWWYSFVLCSEERRPLAALGGFTITAGAGLEELAGADTALLLGTTDTHSDPSPAVLGAIQAAYARGARIASICSGAFVLAATGLLDGRRAATHWRYADLLARRFPAVQVDAQSLYVGEDRVWTSAGTAAGIDLCLHLVRQDHGVQVANRVARRMVVAPHRDGGQTQFIETPLPDASGGDLVRRAMNWMQANLDHQISVAHLATGAHLSSRQFSRRFRAATGLPPGEWLLRQRIQASLPLLEVGAQPVEQVADAVGFQTPAAFRKRFRSALGVSPLAYRRRFGEVSRESSA